MKASKLYKAVRRSTPKGQMIYDVIHVSTGKKVAKTTSWSRNYVALLVWYNVDKGTFRVVNRFGRWDLVWKGLKDYHRRDPAYILVQIEKA